VNAKSGFPAEKFLNADAPLVAGGAPEGLDALALGRLAGELCAQDKERPASILHVARDDQRLAALEAALAFFAPEVRVVSFPAWDCVPYDRVSPNGEIVGRRVAALAELAVKRKQRSGEPVIVLTTVNASVQRIAPRELLRKSVWRLSVGASVPLDDLARRLDSLGYIRTGNVMEPGEYAVRGGIVDLFPSGRRRPVRLDFFGETLESIRSFDTETQRTSRTLKEFVLLPVSEVPFGEETVRVFRQRYVELFGTVTSSDPLYEAISAGARFPGMEHWLPLFHDHLDTLFDYVPGAFVSFDHMAEDARSRRMEQVEDHYDARASALEQKTFGAPPYKPVPKELLFIGTGEWNGILKDRRVISFSPFEVPDSVGGVAAVSLQGNKGRDFAPERAQEGVNVFDATRDHIRTLQDSGRTVIVACWSNGTRERVKSLLEDHGLAGAVPVGNYTEAMALASREVGFAVLGQEAGFLTPELAVIAEQDILGDRLVRRKRNRAASDVISEAASLTPGDLVVHSDHGIARFIGLKTIEAAGAPHDCLELEYHGGDKLYLPVENIELLSRYGSDEAGAQLDRLGGSAWQARKARLKKRIQDIAADLIKVAAARQLKQAPVLETPGSVYEEFCARFPFEETEDQRSSIEAVIEDLAKGRPMDRLVCGDVGFGKTEVALRSALVTVMAGKQVAVVVPTTLLARQHFKTFTERFKGLPVRIAQASRLVAAAELSQTKKGLADGEIDIVVGTHALLGKNMAFADLGLLIIDEEQHFGVQHKERIKQMRDDVHVLTLTATPIPRTLQLALSGVRELSIIATPPVDRLAVRTYVMPFDPMILREALLRERFRGGQTFYVCPRISDLDDAGAFLQEHVPELKVARAHGQMSPGQLDDVMNAFYDGKYDVLLCTTIVESGLDIPTANTLIVHRADRFGLAQLYQLRGRVGRSKTRAYAYFTIPLDQKLTVNAEKRLKVLQSLDTLGAGFTLASHDLDIRGAGNLLGEEQSGHIREVGFELYQSMLEEAVAQARGGGDAQMEDQWSPRIAIGTAVLIPEIYVPDLQVRLGLYRRLSGLEVNGDIDAFAAELVDRFGPLPEEVKRLLDIIQIKGLCRRANIAEVDAGPKGMSIAFRNNSFANPEGLVEFITRDPARIKVMPDHKVVVRGSWEEEDDRVEGVRSTVSALAEIAESAKRAA